MGITPRPPSQLAAAKGESRKPFPWACSKSAGVFEDVSTIEECTPWRSPKWTRSAAWPGLEGIAEKHLAALMATVQRLIFVSRFPWLGNRKYTRQRDGARDECRAQCHESFNDSELAPQSSPRGKMAQAFEETRTTLKSVPAGGAADCPVSDYAERPRWPRQDGCDLLRHVLRHGFRRRVACLHRSSGR